METLVTVAGVIRNAQALEATDRSSLIPPELLTDGERVYEAGESIADLDIAAGDLLVVEVRDDAATGELVLARRGERHYIGRWWAKHGAREVRGAAERVIVKNPVIVGAINLILRTP